MSYRKNVSGQYVGFQLVLAATGAKGTGLTVGVRRCLDGTFGDGGGTVTEDGTTGGYKYALAQADTNANNVSLFFSATGAIPICINFLTTAADPTDGVRLGLTALPNAAADAAGGLPISDAGGLDLDGKLDAAVTSRLASASYTAPDNSGIGAIKTQTDKMAFTVTNQIDANVLDWKSATAPAMTGDAYARIGVAGAGLTALGDTRIANLDATVSSRSTFAGGAVASVTGAVGSVTGLDASKLDVAVSSRLAATDYTAPPSEGLVADAVWNEAIADHLTALTTGASLNAAGSAGDPWSTPLPGAYGDGTAGKIVGTNLDAQVSTAGGGLDAAGVRTAIGLASANLDTQLTPIAAIQAKTDNLPASPAAVSDIPTAIENADALLNRDMSAGTDSGSATVRTPRQALRFPRNKFTMAGNTLTVLKEDDATVSWTSTLTTDVNAEPVVGSDPAGP